MSQWSSIIYFNDLIRVGTFCVDNWQVSGRRSCICQCVKPYAPMAFPSHFLYELSQPQNPVLAGVPGPWLALLPHAGMMVRLFHNSERQRPGVLQIDWIFGLGIPVNPDQKGAGLVPPDRSLLWDLLGPVSPKTVFVDLSLLLSMDPLFCVFFARAMNCGQTFASMHKFVWPSATGNG